MALFTHLTSEAAAASARRSGLRARRRRGLDARGVYCMPVLPSYFLTHQWGRELRRRGYRSTVAVRFRVLDTEPVWVGHYGAAPVEVSAAEASALIAGHADPRGFEVFLPRPVAAGDIRDVRHVRPVAGWRYKPDAHGMPPCPCPACCYAGYGARRIRAARGG